MYLVSVLWKYIPSSSFLLLRPFSVQHILIVGIQNSRYGSSKVVTRDVILFLTVISWSSVFVREL